MRELDKFWGCMVGGAAGDAMGYAIEFIHEPQIFRRFGKDGITQYSLRGGVAQFSEQTLSNGYTLLILTSIRAFHRLQARYRGICNRSEYGEVCFYPSGDHRSQHTRSGQRTFPLSAQEHLYTVSDGR